jgi:hypothetical protein
MPASGKAGDNAVAAIAETWSLMADLQNLKGDRKSKHKDYERLYRTDGYVHTALNILRDRAVSMKDPTLPLFTVQCENEKIIKATEFNLKRMGLVNRQLSRRVLLKQIQFGNEFFQLMLNPDLTLRQMHWLPEEHLVLTNIDEFGNFKRGAPTEKKTGTCAYEIQDEYERFGQGFFEKEIAHFRTCDIDKFHLGSSWLEPIRYSANVLRFQKNMMLVARMTRAYGKVVHYVPTQFIGKTTADWQKDIRYYIDSMRREQMPALETNFYTADRFKPDSVMTDLFLPRFVDLEEKQQPKVEFHEFSNAQLQNVEDVKLSQNEIFCVLRVPKAYMANEEDVTAKATLTDQDMEFLSAVAGMQADYLGQIIEVNNILLYMQHLWSFTDNDLPYSILMPSPYVLNEKQRAEIDKIEAEVGEILTRANIASRHTFRKEYRNMSDEESKAEEQLIAGEQAMFPVAQPGLFGMSTHGKDDERMLQAVHDLRQKVETLKGNGHRVDRVVR